MNNRATINTSSAYHIMHAALLLIIACAGTYHPHAEPLQTSTIPANPLNWLLKDYYSNPQVLNSNILSKYQPNMSTFVIVLDITMLVAIIASFILSCSFQLIKGKMELILICTLLCSLMLFFLLYYYANLRMIIGTANSQYFLQSILQYWSQGSANQFKGLNSLNNLFIQYATNEAALDLDSLTIGGYIDSIINNNNYYNQIASMSLLYELTAVNPTNSTFPIMLPALQIFGPSTLNTTLSYSYYKFDTYLQQEYQMMLNITTIINYSSLRPSLHVYDSLSNVIAELFSYTNNALKPFSIYYDKNINLLYNTTPMLLTLSVAILVVVFISAYFLKAKFIFVIIELLIGALIEMLFITVAGGLLANSISVSQTCDTLSGAVGGNTQDQSYIMDWLLSFKQISEQSTGLIKSCLFGTDAYTYFSNSNVIAQLTTLLKQLNTAFNGLDNWKGASLLGFYQTLVSNLEMSVSEHYLTNLLYFPNSQFSPDSDYMLDALNNLTTSTTPCLIQDTWVFATHFCPSGSTIIISSDTNFGNYPIGPLSCLSVSDINDTFFNIRYNAAFKSRCDPLNQIYNAFSPLSQFALSVRSDALQANSTYYSFLSTTNAYIGYVNNLYYSLRYNNFLDLSNMLIWYKDVTTSTSNDICSDIKQSLNEFVVSKCMWAADSSLCLLYTFVMIVLIGLYLCVVIVSLRQSISNHKIEINQ